MRIVIATGIYPPEIGGPAYYAEGLSRALTSKGHDVEVVTYGDLKKLPMGLRHLAYMAKLFIPAVSADTIIALDTFSVALPAAVLGILTGAKIVIRTGGDFVWEQYLERTGDMVPLPLFYQSEHHLSFKENIIFKLTRWTLSNAWVVFSTEMQRNVWLLPYQLRSEYTSIIENAINPPLSSEVPIRKNFLWHVRPIVMKNGEHVHRAFTEAKKQYPDIVLEEGTMTNDALLERMKNCYAVILPSLTEISPNYILDALRFKKPFIIDKYSGFAEWLAPYGIVVDPLSEEEITRAIVTLARSDGYREAVLKASHFSSVRTYNEVADDFLTLLDKNHSHK